MKVQVITDEEGALLAMAPESVEVKTADDGPTHAQMVAGPSQCFRILAVDQKLYDLPFAELRADYRVSLIGEPCLVPVERKIKNQSTKQK